MARTTYRVVHENDYDTLLTDPDEAEFWSRNGWNVTAVTEGDA